MIRFFFATMALIGVATQARAYIEVPHSLGKCVQDSTHIVLVEVTKVNVEKNLIIFKKVTDIKGKYPTNEIKHNIGKKGFHEREWKNIMAWAAEGKKAVFMLNGDASETCIGTYWYQAYREGDWWGMSHAEPFLLRTYYGDAEKLAAVCTRILKNEEVVVTCLADGSKEQLHLRKGKVQRLKASLKKQDYDPKKDFVGWGGDGDDDFEEFKTVELLKASSPGWRYLSAKGIAATDLKWAQPSFDDAKWTSGTSPMGYGEVELATRKGTAIAEKGQAFLFRRVVDIPADLLAAKGVQFRLSIASDDNASVYWDGTAIDNDPEADHEFAYWNRDINLPLNSLKAGRHTIAVIVRNKPASSDLYFDLEVAAQIPIPRPPRKATTTPVAGNPKEGKTPTVVPEEPRDPNALKIDAATKTITIVGEVAVRKLPNLDQKYPIEVVGTYPSPRGQKAHETVLAFKGVRPSDVHKALETLGLKAGKPAYGEGTKADGPIIKVLIEFTGKDGKPERLPIEKCLVHRDTGKPMVALTWHFTGSVTKQPDPEKDATVYGADLTGTFLSLFPVTDCCVLQTQLTMKDEPNYKLETDGKVLPKEGTSIKLLLLKE